MRKTLKGFGLAVLVLVLVGAGGGVATFANGGTMSGPLTVNTGGATGKCVIRGGATYCDVGFLKTPFGSTTTGMYFNALSPVIYSNGSPLATFNSGTGNLDLVYGMTAATTAVVSQYVRIGQFFQADGETQAVLQARVPTGGGLEYDTTNTKWRAFENGNWNYVATVNADGGIPLLPIGASAKATQAEANSRQTGFALVSDRSPYGKLPMVANDSRLVQIGGGVNWGLEARTLTINPFFESALCPRCTECTGTTVSAMDGQACTDDAAGSTTVIDAIDFRTFVTVATSTHHSDWNSRVAETRRNKYPHFVMTAMTTGTATRRVWYGLSSATLFGSDAPVSHMVAFRYSTNASDTKWQFCTGDGATTTCSDTGVTVTANRSYRLEADCRDAAAGKCIATIVAQVTGTPVTIEKTTNLPGTSSNMFIRHTCETLSAGAITCGLGPSVLETL